MKKAMVGKFKIGGNLRFLSHHETLKLLQRALVRSDINLLFNGGCNPRPKLSLPLPRSVGVESDEELFCVFVDAGETVNGTSQCCRSVLDIEEFKAKVTAQLPDGFELITVEPARSNTTIHPSSAVYILPLRSDLIDEELRSRVEQLSSKRDAGYPIVVERRTSEKGNTRWVDVSSFIESTEFDGMRITVKCKITPTGSVRVGEIMKLLGIDYSMLERPIKRTAVCWEKQVKSQK